MLTLNINKLLKFDEKYQQNWIVTIAFCMQIDFIFFSLKKLST